MIMNELFKGSVSQLFKNAKDEKKSLGVYLKDIYELH
ncbi:Uncharacterised protein [Niallia circulans]|nr:Uncharacterised protein [Niallia circulans]